MANIISNSQDNYSAEKIFAQDFKREGSNIVNGLPNANGKFGGIGGDIDKDALGLGGEGIDLGFENVEGIVSVGNAFDSNPFDAMFDGSLSPFGLTKSECFSIKSLGVLASLNSLSLAKQFKGLRGNTSIISSGMEQG
ncbi:MAG: hypothetical protein EBT63_06255 [Proteobacteria bacterium]|jgi:hypothetical protein|nr:hypothetical protein [Pseudomonadota bacterium]NCA28655.1 hypothetical protein [Pseudomonadota bacterium]